MNKPNGASMRSARDIMAADEPNGIWSEFRHMHNYDEWIGNIIDGHYSPATEALERVSEILLSVGTIYADKRIIDAMREVDEISKKALTVVRNEHQFVIKTTRIGDSE